MTDEERKELIQKNLRASKSKWKDLSADITERVMQGTRLLLSPNYKYKSTINETEIESLGRNIYDGFPDDFKKNPTDEALDRLLRETSADIVPKWEKGLDWDSLTGKFAPNKQFEFMKGVSSSKSNEQPSGELGKWLKEFNEDRANIPGVYNKKQDQVFRLGGELPPRYTGWDDEPSEEVLTQIRARNAIKGGNALIDQYNSLRKLSTPLTIAPPSPYQFRESANLAQVDAPETMLAGLPEGTINPFVRGSSPQSLIGAGGKYSNSPLNRIANLNISPSNTREKTMTFKIPELNEVFPDTQQGRGDLYQSQRFGFGTPNDALTRFQAGKPQYRADRQGWQNLQDSRIADRREGMSLYPGGQKFMGEERDTFMQDFRDATGYRGGDVEKTLRDNISFGLGSVDPRDPPPGKDKTDWLGWAGIGTGLFKGAGGVLDYFSNMKGLELAEQAMNKKYAADDRNYLAQAISLNNVIDQRKDYIDKTQGGRNTDFLQNIPV